MSSYPPSEESPYPTSPEPIDSTAPYYASPEPTMAQPHPGAGEPPQSGKVKKRRPWLVPLITGVLAFTIGFAAGGGSDAPEEEASEPVSTSAADDGEIAGSLAEAEAERDGLAADLEVATATMSEAVTERDDLAEEAESLRQERDDLATNLEEAQTERDAAVARAEGLEAAADAQEADAVAAAEDAAASSVTFGDGTWRVGEDIEPGTYRTGGNDFCYWERLSGFSGEFNDIITNDFSSGPGTVTIQGSDAGFTSQGCGTWDLQD